MQAYSSARMEYGGKEGIFLDANENSLGSVTKEQHNRYPDPLQTDLKHAVAKYENIQTGQIFLGNGSDECINVLIQCFCIPGRDNVMILSPSFSMYEHASKVMNIGIIEVLLQEETFQLRLAEMKKVIDREQERLKLIFICSPNNPTGNLIRKQDIEELLQSFNGLVVIDEAYQDFAGNTSWVRRLDEFRNLVVIKTFSKAWGMADARLGMLYANEEIVHYMNLIKMPYNVNQHTIGLAMEALQKQDTKVRFVSVLLEGRKKLEVEMRQIPFIQKLYPSDANFILFRVADADGLYKYLLQQRVIVRNRNKAPLCKGCLRVSVGTKEENDKFITVLKNYQPS
jgi:histidinol-phosphate aminotransferase